MIFRYPGGKSRIVKEIRKRMESRGFLSGDSFHDVFVGGGSVLLHVAGWFPRSPLFANDIDPWINSFWEVVVGPKSQFNEFLEKLRITPTVDSFVLLRNSAPDNRLDRAFRAVFFNRTTFSGMFTSGPIGGYNQTGRWKIDCRYNHKAMVSAMLYMREKLRLDERLHVTGIDAVSYVSGVDDGFMYLDPPYMGQGKALYREAVDHHSLAQILRNKKKWLLTYDDCDDVRMAYGYADIEEIPMRYSIRGKKKEWVGNKELFITPSLR